MKSSVDEATNLLEIGSCHIQIAELIVIRVDSKELFISGARFDKFVVHKLEHLARASRKRVFPTLNSGTLTKTILDATILVFTFVSLVSCTERIGTFTAACSKAIELAANWARSSELIDLFVIFFDTVDVANVVTFHLVSFSSLE